MSDAQIPNSGRDVRTGLADASPELRKLYGHFLGQPSTDQAPADPEPACPAGRVAVWDDPGNRRNRVAPCGHYLLPGTYACSTCNIGPLSRIHELERQLRDCRQRLLDIANLAVADLPGEERR